MAKKYISGREIEQRPGEWSNRLLRGAADGSVCPGGGRGGGPEGSCVGPRTFFSVPRGAMRGWAGLFRGDYFAFWKDSPVWCGAAGQRGAPLGAIAGIRAG